MSKRRSSFLSCKGFNLLFAGQGSPVPHFTLPTHLPRAVCREKSPWYVSLGHCKHPKASPSNQKSHKNEKAEYVCARPASLNHFTVSIATKNISIRVGKKIRTCMACHSLFHQPHDWLPWAAGELWVLEELSCCFYFPSEIPRRHKAIFVKLRLES